MAFGTWQSRHASAVLPALTLLKVADLTPPQETPQFAVMEAQTMGTLGTPADGWYVSYNPVIAEFANEPGALSGLNGQLVAAGFTPGQISAQQYAPIGSVIASTTKSGGQQLTDLDGGIAGTAPTSGGGGSGGSGGGSGGGGGCQPNQPPAAQPCASADWGGYPVNSENARVLNPMLLHAPNPDLWYIWSNTIHTVATLLHGDASIFQLQITHESAEGTGPPLYDVILSAYANKAGHFGAVVQVHQDGQNPVLFGACVDIGSCSASGGSTRSAVQEPPAPLAIIQSRIPLPGARPSLQPGRK